ncbi:transcriptional repressor [Acidiferrimicrobium sp. IK]|uniref:Fur family transcriptional regulator n=1 Tax=Acidiferrimicrobium sp. IK TaxID=2871700 RepID=UPI0021CB7BB5|nr:transcriptional repressor [Acidiferrimicrobium sp. IK]MCU4184079.1 transcriptional repressor [Acidiferrimicrobium sp. IK]
MKSPAELADAFRARGLKVTPQRECIFGVLHGSAVHPTAEAVYAVARERMPTMSLKTVYQTLNDLAEMGEIQQLDVGTGASRFDPNVDPHHHLVCRVCGKIRDLHVEYPGLDVPANQQQGFAVEDAEVVFRGVCAQCAAAPQVV